MEINIRAVSILRIFEIWVGDTRNSLVSMQAPTASDTKANAHFWQCLSQKSDNPKNDKGMFGKTCKCYDQDGVLSGCPLGSILPLPLDSRSGLKPLQPCIQFLEVPHGHIRFRAKLATVGLVVSHTVARSRPSQSFVRAALSPQGWILKWFGQRCNVDSMHSAMSKSRRIPRLQNL